MRSGSCYRFLCLFFVFRCLILQVVGHGFVHFVEIDGQEYAGWNPFSDPYVQSMHLYRFEELSTRVTQVQHPKFSSHKESGE